MAVPLASRDELLDLLRAARPIPPQRADDAGRQLATTGERRVGDLLPFGRDDRVLPGGDAERVELGLGEAQARDQFLGRVRGEQAFDEVGRAFLERAARSAVGVAFDPAVIRVERVGGHAGQLERPGVDPGRVAVAALEEDRPIRHDPVEIVAVWDAAREVGHRPAVAADPRLVRVRGGVRRDRRQVGVQPARIGQVAAQPADAGTHRVDVGVPETRRHRSAAQLDDTGPRSDPAAHGVVATDRDDPPLADRDGSRERPARVHRGHAATTEDEIGRAVVGHGRRMARRPAANRRIPSVATDARAGRAPRSIRQ